MNKVYKSHRCDFGQPYNRGTDSQMMRSGSRNTSTNARLKGKRRNPSSVRLVQMGPHLIPRGKGYAHGAMMDEHFRYMP